ncbi:MAG: ATP-binding cassette domain-containing protein [Myxococcota bacterium]|jgi:phospholipid/cholesterol/gamma-HCH transport system ATP-binding protein|nr:ATP-binding cassette domain-containing protein [Myxococcota bacterium]
MASVALEVRGLVARYGERTILDGVDLTVHRHEIRVILGGSGCGKSTLLKHCIGLNLPAAGTVRLLGAALEQLEGPARDALLIRTGVLFQNGALLGSLTVGENVALPLQEHTSLPAELIAELVRLKLAQVEMSHAEHLLPSEISGGMRKRAALARAMALDPEILFCDEPSAGLDPLTSAELDALLLRLRDRFGMAIVVVTHELASIEIISDRVTMLAAGKVLADGPLAEVRASSLPEIQAFFRRIAAGEMRREPSAWELLGGGGES